MNAKKVKSDYKMKLTSDHSGFSLRFYVAGVF